MKVRFKLLNDRAIPPRTSEGDAGSDLYAAHDLDLQQFGFGRVDLGIAVEIPQGYYGDLRGRSGNTIHGRFVMSGVIDSGYRGSISAVVFNVSRDTMRIKRGDRVAQLVITPYLTVEWEASHELSDSERGSNGFGSSGVR